MLASVYPAILATGATNPRPTASVDMLAVCVLGDINRMVMSHHPCRAKGVSLEPVVKSVLAFLFIPYAQIVSFASAIGGHYRLHTQLICQAKILS